MTEHTAESDVGVRDALARLRSRVDDALDNYGQGGTYLAADIRRTFDTLTPDPPAEFKAALASLVAEHAPHGFAGFMRTATDGCRVYVAAVALQDALRQCTTPPNEAHA